MRTVHAVDADMTFTRNMENVEVVCRIDEIDIGRILAVSDLHSAVLTVFACEFVREVAVVSFFAEGKNHGGSRLHADVGAAALALNGTRATFVFDREFHARIKLKRAARYTLVGRGDHGAAAREFDRAARRHAKPVLDGDVERANRLRRSADVDGAARHIEKSGVAERFTRAENEETVRHVRVAGVVVLIICNRNRAALENDVASARDLRGNGASAARFIRCVNAEATVVGLDKKLDRSEIPEGVNAAPGRIKSAAREREVGGVAVGLIDGLRELVGICVENNVGDVSIFVKVLDVDDRQGHAVVADKDAAAIFVVARAEAYLDGRFLAADRKATRAAADNDLAAVGAFGHAAEVKDAAVEC